MYTCRSVVSRCGCVALRRHGAAGEGVVDAAFVAVPAAPPPSKGALLRRSVASAFQNVSAPPEKKVSLRLMAGPPGGQLLSTDTRLIVLYISMGIRQTTILHRKRNSTSDDKMNKEHKEKIPRKRTVHHLFCIIT